MQILRHLPAYFIIIAGFFILSCGGDDDIEDINSDFIGSWVMTSIRDDCPDASNNVKVNAGQNGYYQNASNGGKECIMLQLDINQDGSIVLESQITLIAGSIVTPQSPTFSNGSYSTSENTIIATFSNGDIIAFMGNSSKTMLDWTISTSPSGCYRKWGFVRQ